MSIHRMRFAAVFALFGSPAFAGHDFNGDGFDDLAIGVPLEDTAPNTNSGAVHVLYGGAAGVTGTGSQFFTPQSLLGVTEDLEGFGVTLCGGDFDGDGFSDLAICAHSSASGLLRAGNVYVLYGSASGLDATTLQTWNQDSPGIKDKVEADPLSPGASDEGFGARLLAADFTGDGFDDLAICVLEGLGKGAKAKSGAGGVHVILGSSAGLTAKKNQFWTQDSKGVPGVSGSDFLFGVEMAAGDIDGDGRADLAVSALLDVTGPVGRGSVTILRGAKSGLTAKKSRRITQFDVGLSGYPIQGFSGALAWSDLNDDGFDDLAIGAPSAVTPIELDGGVFALAFGAKNGPVTEQAVQYYGGGPVFEDLGVGTGSFAAALALGDFDGDGIDDLVVGSSADDIAGQASAGSLRAMRGAPSGPTQASIGLFSQGTNGVPDTAESGDRFGSAIAVGDFNGDGADDVAVAAPQESVGAVAGGGIVIVLYGSGTGLVTAGSTVISQATAGVADVVEPDDRFGVTLCR